ncbi:MAG: hypothetical protein JRH01_06775, partial [Deltaproteobacteria bacterium]|nr:hypothetical protein [Deltaproteobacteria bacterium]
ASTVIAPTFTIQNVVVDLDKQADRANYEIILDNLARFESADDDVAQTPTEDAGPEKRFVIHEFVIRDIEARLHLMEARGDRKLTVLVPEVRMTNLGGEGEPLTAAELSGVVIKAVLASIAKVGVALPGGVASALSSGLGRLGSVSIDLPKGGKLVDAASGVLEAGADAVGSAADTGKATASKAGEGLKGLVGNLRGDD